MDNIATFFLLLILFIATFFFVCAGITATLVRKKAEQKTAENIAINNTIVDLHETGHITATGEKGNRGVSRAEGQTTLAGFHQKVLDSGFQRDTNLSTEEFHTNIYNSREALVNALGENAGIDRDTKPSTRIYSSISDDGSSVVLPLLFLGTAEGSHFSYNPAYHDSTAYVGSAEISGRAGK